MHILTGWSYIGDELHQSAQPGLLVVSQAFVVVQANIFVLCGSQYLKVCQDQSVSQHEDYIQHLQAG